MFPISPLSCISQESFKPLAKYALSSLYGVGIGTGTAYALHSALEIIVYQIAYQLSLKSNRAHSTSEKSNATDFVIKKNGQRLYLCLFSNWTDIGYKRLIYSVCLTFVISAALGFRTLSLFAAMTEARAREMRGFGFRPNMLEIELDALDICWLCSFFLPAICHYLSFIIFCCLRLSPRYTGDVGVVGTEEDDVEEYTVSSRSTETTDSDMTGFTDLDDDDSHTVYKDKSTLVQDRTIVIENLELIRKI
jgi:hypothetical protein